MKKIVHQEPFPPPPGHSTPLFFAKYCFTDSDTFHYVGETPYTLRVTYAPDIEYFDPIVEHLEIDEAAIKVFEIYQYRPNTYGDLLVTYEF